MPRRYRRRAQAPSTDAIAEAVPVGLNEAAVPPAAPAPPPLPAAAESPGRSASATARRDTGTLRWGLLSGLLIGVFWGFFSPRAPWVEPTQDRQGPQSRDSGRSEGYGL